MVPGVVLAYLLHGSLEVWGGVSAVFAAWGIARVGRSARLGGGDAAIAVVFTTAFGAGLALISASGSYLTDLTEILFGNVLAVDATARAISSAAAVVVVLTLIALFHPLLVVAFDRPPRRRSASHAIDSTWCCTDSRRWLSFPAPRPRAASWLPRC